MPGWQTAVMVLVAFIVGLLPYVVTQGKWATKDEVAVIRDKQAEGLLQVTANKEHLNAVDVNITELQKEMEILRSQITEILRTGAYNPGPDPAGGGASG
jgi:uncharacterized protein YpmS